MKRLYGQRWIVFTDPFLSDTSGVRFTTRGPGLRGWYSETAWGGSKIRVGLTFTFDDATRYEKAKAESIAVYFAVTNPDFMGHVHVQTEGGAEKLNNRELAAWLKTQREMREGLAR